MRVCDADRDEALGELRLRYAEGRLSNDTFLSRMDAVLSARYRGELDAQLADLPRPGSHRGLLRGVRLRLARWLSRLAAALPARDAPLPARLELAADAVRLPPSATGQGIADMVLPAGTQRKFTIGRDLACDFTVAHLSVSRWHAVLSRDDDRWLLSDLGSTNGTRLNGWRVSNDVPLRPGDRLTLGAVTFVIIDRAAPGPTAEPAAEPTAQPGAA
jgi:hypothetical protein